jgi:hypothetical protein
MATSKLLIIMDSLVHCPHLSSDIRCFGPWALLNPMVLLGIVAQITQRTHLAPLLQIPHQFLDLPGLLASMLDHLMPNSSSLLLLLPNLQFLASANPITPSLGWEFQL